MMHGQRYNHGDITRRQGLVGGTVSSVLAPIIANPAQTPPSSDTTPLLGPILGGAASALQPPQPSSPPVALTSSPSSVSSSASTFSSTSSTPTPSITSIITSTSDGTPVIVTATVHISPPSSVAVPKPFFQNKPLETSVFVAVGLIAAVLIILLLAVWVRSNNRRKLNREALDFNPSVIYGFRDNERSSMEKLVRWNSTSSAGHTDRKIGQAGYGPRVGQGTYPAPPLLSAHPADGYGQPPIYHGQLPQGPGYNSTGACAAYVAPRTPNPIYDPGRPPTPPTNIIAAMPSGGPRPDEVNPILPPSQNMPVQQYGSSFDSPPSSSPASGENKGNLSRYLSFHSKALNPGMQDMPVAPPLPAKFGSDNDDGERPYSGMESDFGYDINRALKIANQ